MRLPRVYPILDTESLAQRRIAPEMAAAAFLEGGAGILQIRHKQHWDRNIFATARTLAKMCREAGVALVINDRADVAMLLDAGLHVGQDDLPPRDARKLMGTDAFMGYSSHNSRQACEAGGEPVDYVALGPIFPTASKLNPDPATGVDELRRCRALIDKPLVAIGGITQANALEVMRAGADSVAIIGGLLPGTEGASATAQSLRDRMEQWQQLLKAA
jgi:thiamine-phosphate pyrophosphorylase